MCEGGDQRRLSAILAAHLVADARRLEQDTEGTVAAWRVVRAEIIDPIIARHSGRIVEHTGGGFVPEFRTAHWAVACALSMQKGPAQGPGEPSGAARS
jgi:class 3 adenylate cyclase